MKKFLLLFCVLSPLLAPFCRSSFAQQAQSGYDPAHLRVDYETHSEQKRYDTYSEPGLVRGLWNYAKDVATLNTYADRQHLRYAGTETATTSESRYKVYEGQKLIAVSRWTSLSESEVQAEVAKMNRELHEMAARKSRVAVSENCFFIELASNSTGQKRSTAPKAVTRSKAKGSASANQAEAREASRTKMSLAPGL